MSATLHVRDVVVTLGAEEVLAGATFSAFPGQRVGVIGPNGVGKSTLLKVAAGLIRPERGDVTVLPKSATVGYLPQERDRQASETVLAFLGRRTGVAAAELGLDQASAALAREERGAAETYAAALDRFLHLGAADFSERAAATLAELSLDRELLARPTAALSGGQAARVSLASILLSRHDVLLLDEPTNDLDFDGLSRLEAFVRGAPATVVVISHDRAFLEAVITDVVEIDAHARTAASYHGGWAAFEASRRVAQDHAAEDYAVFAKKRAELEDRARTQREWSSRGIGKAKHDAKEKDKHIKAFRTKTSEKQAAKARATERAMERLEVVAKPWRHWELAFEIAEAPRSGDVVARLTGAVVRRGAFTLGPLDLLVRVRERVAIVGPNGAGKSTLVRALLGQVPLAAGSAVLGPGVVWAELDQERRVSAGHASILDGFVAETGLTAQEARTLLAKFGLAATHVARPAASLSPGERTRVALALFQARQVNTLVLDEPTNHLDLPAIEQLESALERFGGTVLLISHDRRLLERFNPTRTLVVEGGQVREEDRRT